MADHVRVGRYFTCVPDAQQVPSLLPGHGRMRILADPLRFPVSPGTRACVHSDYSKYVNTGYRYCYAM